MSSTIYTYFKIPGDDGYHQVAQQIIKDLDSPSGRALHFTNGTFSMPAEKILPTALAGFAHINSIAGPDDVFAIAINSDQSMFDILKQKNASDEEIAKLESMEVRIGKIMDALAQEFLGCTFVIIPYDESTPTELYNTLAEEGVNLGSLHKWGYGTEPTGPRIEGAHNFPRVFGHPLPNDEKPVCYDVTVEGNQTGYVEIVDLRAGEKPFITKEGKYITGNEFVNFLMGNTGPKEMMP